MKEQHRGPEKFLLCDPVFPLVGTDPKDKVKRVSDLVTSNLQQMGRRKTGNPLNVQPGEVANLGPVAHIAERDAANQS